MTAHVPQEVTRLLQAWCRGEESTFEKLLPLVYAELHQLTHIYMVRERLGHTLQTSALVSEAYFRLIEANQVEWQDRAHFFAISSNVMRRILLEFARSRRSGRRGGDAVQVEFQEGFIPSAQKSADLIALDDALTALGEIDPREAKVVELRFFGGLSLEETAEVLKVSTRTVMREWDHAKLWLLKELHRR